MYVELHSALTSTPLGLTRYLTDELDSRLFEFGLFQPLREWQLPNNHKSYKIFFLHNFLSIFYVALVSDLISLLLLQRLTTKDD